MAPPTLEQIPQGLQDAYSIGRKISDTRPSSDELEEMWMDTMRPQSEVTSFDVPALGVLPIARWDVRAIVGVDDGQFIFVVLFVEHFPVHASLRVLESRFEAACRPLVPA